MVTILQFSILLQQSGLNDNSNGDLTVSKSASNQLWVKFLDKQKPDIRILNLFFIFNNQQFKAFFMFESNTKELKFNRPCQGFRRAFRAWRVGKRVRNYSDCLRISFRIISLERLFWKKYDCGWQVTVFPDTVLWTNMERGLESQEILHVFTTETVTFPWGISETVKYRRQVKIVQTVQRETVAT